MNLTTETSSSETDATLKTNGLATVQSVSNHVGHESYDINSPLLKLRIMAASSFFGEPSFYNRTANKNLSGDSRVIFKEILNILATGVKIDYSGGTAAATEQAIDAALAYNIEETLRIAVELRNEDNIRTTPQIIMVRAANHPAAKGTGLINKYYSDIMKRPDEVAVQMSYHFTMYGRQIPTSLKRAWAKFTSSLGDFQLAKYKTGANDVNLIDVVRLTHASSPSIDKMMRNTLSLNESTWESYISANGSTKANWQHAFGMMGHMALLKNLRNLQDCELDDDIVTSKLIGGVKGGKQMPYSYYSAYLNVTNKKYKDALSQCINASLENVPVFEGRVAALCDNSGSARSAMQSSMGSVRVNFIANLSALMTCARSTRDDSVIVPFGEKCKIYPVVRNENILDSATNICEDSDKLGGCHEGGLFEFFINAINNGDHYDHIFIYSDLQAGHGQLYGSSLRHKYKNFICSDGSGGRDFINLPALINEYRTKVNKDVNVFSVQVAGYSNQLTPDIYDKTYILGGWSTNTLKWAHRMSTLVK